MIGYLTHAALKGLMGILDHADAEQGQPFQRSGMMVPHTRSARYGWTHYGVMIPDLPAPHRFFSIMSLVGTPGALAFDTDHALADTPRRSATVVSGTAATHPSHFGGYSIERDCEMRDDGSVLRFGEHVDIRGAYPEYRVRARYGDFDLDIEIRNTDKVSWFIRSAVYDHLSLLSHYSGGIQHRGERREISGLCTFEYAACASPHSLRDRRLPARMKLPVDFFTYQVINLASGTQLLLTQVMVGGRPILTAAYLRSAESYSRTLHDTRFEVLELQDGAAESPDGRRMQLPRRFLWTVRDEGREVLLLEGTVDTPFTYGLGSGYVGGYRYTGQQGGETISGRGYIEYIDRRGA